MKPYGREKKIMSFKCKIDYHIHENNRKIGNWWEDSNNIVPRSTMKLNLRKQLNKEN